MSKDPSGREGVRKTPFIVRNGSDISIEGLSENDVVDGGAPHHDHCLWKRRSKTVLDRRERNAQKYTQLGLAATHCIWRMGHLLFDNQSFFKLSIMDKKHDICGLEDIKIMVDEFYTKVQKDELLAPIFNFRLSTHWGPHLEKMYLFWNAALFGEKGYTGNPFMKHATMELTQEHFEHWLNMFNETVDEFFEGPMADDAKRRAMIMATNFARRINDNNGSGNITLV